MAAQRVVGAHRQTQADVILGERTVRDVPDDVCRPGMRCLHQAGGCAGGLNEQRDRTGLMLGRDRTGRDRTGEDRTISMKKANPSTAQPKCRRRRQRV